MPHKYGRVLTVTYAPPTNGKSFLLYPETMGGNPVSLIQLHALSFAPPSYSGSSGGEIMEVYADYRIRRATSVTADNYATAVPLVSSDTAGFNSAGFTAYLAKCSSVTVNETYRYLTVPVRSGVDYEFDPPITCLGQYNSGTPIGLEIARVASNYSFDVTAIYTMM